MRRLISAGLIPAIAFVFLVACNGDDAQNDSVHGLSVRLTEVQVQLMQNSGTSAYQVNSLSDGVLTFEEYERALFAMFKCSNDAGADVGTTSTTGTFSSSPRLTSRKRYVYAFRFPADASPNIESKVRACQSEYSDVVEQIWTEASSPTQAEVIQARARLVRCMQDAGVPVPNDPTTEQLHEFTQLGVADDRYFRCAAQVADEFDIPGFGG